MSVAFLLNGTPVRVEGEAPTRTLLDWLRETRGLCGTKEGCNEGDCGACTVMVTDAEGSKALNACILFLPQLDGKAVRTVEGISGPGGQMHPVQEAMVQHHGSQCGFCTPGFVVSMAVAHLNGATDHDDQLAGNLCRCTGYAPIVRAAEAVESAPVPEWMRADALSLPQISPEGSGEAGGLPGAFSPRDSDEVAEWSLANPEAVLIAGATDVGLWVTKALRDLKPVAFLNGVRDLQGIEVQGGQLHVGACVTIAALQAAVAGRLPSFAELLRRYASV
ncbi:2Fe-2S iron-sulfur cluster-binding protein, partial [Tabrizicola sp.]|uniref:2Fe-2S iron-sulfur cluster-binding protein n=1 Tax=Tabrizicola sp. TaxID=2005166 RepID=UPI003F3C8B30